MADSGHSGPKEEKKAGNGGGKNFMVDRFISGLTDWIAEGIGKFVAFILFMVTVGAVFGYFVAVRDLNALWLMAPAVVGLIAYYERDIAIVLFVIILVIVL